MGDDIELPPWAIQAGFIQIVDEPMPYPSRDEEELIYQWNAPCPDGIDDDLDEDYDEDYDGDIDESYDSDGYTNGCSDPNCYLCHG